MKQTLSQKMVVCYWLMASVFIGSTLLPPYSYSWLVKLLPILILAFALFKAGSERLFLLGILASACGDFLLDYDREHWFIFGLAAFFVAHLFYISALRPFDKKRFIFIGSYCLYGILIFTLLAPGLGELFIPVFAYMLVLLIMGISTLVSRLSNQYLQFGGVFFVLSDSLIGIDKFYSPIPYAHFYVMLTYYLAQFCLVKGLFNAKFRLSLCDVNN